MSGTTGDFTSIVTGNLKATGISTLGNLKVDVAGIVTAVSGVVTYYGDGANLTNLPASTTISGNGDNKVITGSASANTLTAESALTFGGSPHNILNVGAGISCYGNSGIVSATAFYGDAFYGDGSNLTGAGPTLANGSNDRVVTATGANALTGESNLIYDGTTLNIDGNVSSTTQFSGLDGLRIHNANGSAHNVTADMYFTAGTGSSNRGAALGVQFTSAASGNDLYFATNGGNVTSTNTLTERLRITSAGKILIGTTTPQGNANADDLVVATSGTTGILSLIHI